MTTLDEQIKKVHKLRGDVAFLQTAEANLKKVFLHDNQELYDTMDKVKTECAEAEQALRELTLQAYKDTGNKAPSPGVGIRIITKLIYDVGKAFEWAKQHGLALKLDTPAFEKIAKASKPDFVENREEAQATIATDLSKVLYDQEELQTYQARREAISGKGG